MRFTGLLEMCLCFLWDALHLSSSLEDSRSDNLCRQRDRSNSFNTITLVMNIDAAHQILSQNITNPVAYSFWMK
jgi:hypothetical protein